MATYGQITINGQNYIERTQTFPQVVTVASNGQVLSQQRVSFPGVAPFLLKSLARTTIKSNAAVTTCPFRFRLGNSDGGTWYMAGGLGGTTDRVMDFNIFGNGQFPYVLTPYIFFSAQGSLLFEVEDISNNTPYSIEFAFGGSYLIAV